MYKASPLKKDRPVPELKALGAEFHFRKKVLDSARSLC
jgi:hypothetical protein